MDFSFQYGALRLSGLGMFSQIKSAMDNPNQDGALNDSLKKACKSGVGEGGKQVYKQNGCNPTKDS